MELVLVILYCSFLSFILLFSINQFQLVLLYIFKKTRLERAEWQPGEYPPVTVQLPVYNEKLVIRRLIEAVVAFEYPRDKLSIQVLDDSTDETVGIVDEQVNKWAAKGFDIEHLRRPDRIGFKAGALQYGLERAKGEFIAIFDADFIPKPDFLVNTLQWFRDDSVGVVQTRWSHLNDDYSMLTRLQSYALNAHFTIEQCGRNLGGHFINFNGTAGVWRKATIYDAGGWRHDTLTEDLDLSFRAQLRGWHFQYLEEVDSPAELPVEMNGLKSQQFRWSKGAAECARINLLKVLKSSKTSFLTKVNAFFHLMNSFTYICLVGSGLLFIPLMFVHKYFQGYEVVFSFFNIFHITFILLFIFYLVANSRVGFSNWKDYLVFIYSYPVFLSLSMGISLYNSVGVVEGWLNKKTPFVRTPKFNVLQKKDSWNGNPYVRREWNLVTLMEGLCFAVFLFGIGAAVQLGNFIAVPYLLMMAGGFGTVLYLSYFHHKKARLDPA